MASAPSPRSESQLTSTSTSTSQPNNSTSTPSHPHPHTQPPAVTITPASPSATPASATSVTLEPPIPVPASAQTPTPTSTPISTSTDMKEKDNAPSALPTDSKTALLNNSRSSTAASKKEGMDKDINARGTTAATPSAPTVTLTTTTASHEKPSSSSALPSSSAQASSASSKPSTTKPTERASQKKRRKRKGLAGFLLALGCLSADEFEDEPKATKDDASKAGPSATATTSKKDTATTSTPAGTSKPSDSSSAPVAGHGADATGTTSTTLVSADTSAEETGAKQAKEVVLAPPEPHILPEEETAGVTSSAVQPPGGGSSVLLGTPSRPHPQRRESEAGVEPTSDVAQSETTGAYAESDLVDESNAQGGEEGIEEYMEEDYEDEEDRLIEQGGMGIPIDENGQPAPLLPPLLKAHTGRKCLVLDLDETLLHSSFKSLPTADYIVPVEIESQIHNVYVIKRPGVDNFLKEMGKIYEVVVFTASLSKYADPVLDMLDTHRVVTHRLFRESCYNHKGNYVKDLSQLGREIETSIIIDNSPASYIFHPNNAVPVSTWFNDPHDTELTDLCPFLADLATVDDVRGVLDGRLVYNR